MLSNRISSTNFLCRGDLFKYYLRSPKDFISCKEFYDVCKGEGEKKTSQESQKWCCEPGIHQSLNSEDTDNWGDDISTTCISDHGVLSTVDEKAEIRFFSEKVDDD